MDINIRPAWAEINLDSIAYNMKEVKRLSGNRDIIAVVKADAYGHGAIDVVDTMIENGATRLAVAVITEAIELRKSGVKVPIMILGYTPLEFAEELINYDIEQTVYSLEYAKELAKVAENINKSVKIHIAVDTGMGRIGFLPNENSIKDVSEIYYLQGLDTIGIFTHFATADEKDKEYTHEQYSNLEWFYKELEKKNVNIKIKHAANSAAIMELPGTHLDGVRAGIILYGYYPSEEVDKNKISLKPALTLKTKVVHVKKLTKDKYVSYGRKFKTERESIIATLPIGYADGYTRLLSGKAKVIINGKFAPVIGRICMDQCMIDVTDVGKVEVGDEVILLGEEGDLKYNADDMANDIGTINYEIICMLKQRVPRVYIKNNEVISIRNYI